MSTDPTVLTKYLDPLNVPPVVNPDSTGYIAVTMQNATVQLHSQLPASQAWAYDGLLPGPTIEVQKGETAYIDWVNELSGSLPLDVATGAALFSENVPGVADGVVDTTVPGIPPYTVVHLHGAQTGSNSDGWTENTVMPGQRQVTAYTNNQNATALWYHDHGMNITRMTVQSGLAGTYLIRDNEEDALGLPSGQYEIPLMIRDLNLNVDANGNPTGRQLIKTEAAVPVFFGPYTMVNGTIWPYLNVRARHYRFRLTNVSSARMYRFVLVDEGGNPIPNVMYQIGTDQGLLPAPAEIDVNGIVLAPAERADILIDFTTLAGHNIRLMNIAPTPFTGAPVAPGSFPPAPNPSAHLPEPDVMQFRVGSTPVSDGFTLPSVLASSFTRLTDANMPAHTTRVLALAAKVGQPGPFQLWELAPAPTGTSEPVIQIKDSTGATNGYVVVAKGLEDTVNWFPLLNGWEEWQIVNLSPFTHPIHLHLVKFQAIARELYDVSGFNGATGATGAGTPVAYTGPGVLGADEQGFKDVIRVYPGDMVRIGAQFPEYNGRYMYHCHLLDHEDEGMMRVFTVMPPAIEARMPSD